MEFVVSFIGTVESENWNEIHKKIFEMLENMDNIFEEYEVFVEENKEMI